MANLSMLDIAIMNAPTEGIADLVEEAAETHPEWTVGSARTINGRNYQTLVRTGVPSVAFRDANEGTAETKGTYENRLVQTAIMNPEWSVDKAVADSAEDGAEALIAVEAAALLEGALQTLCSQFYYGTSNDAKGFQGFTQLVDSSMEYDAGGDSNKTSVWGVRFGPGHVQWLLGNGGQVAVEPVEEVRLEDSSGNPYRAYWQDLICYPAVQVKSRYSIGRIKQIEEDTNTLDDDMIDELVALWPEGTQPDAIFMNGRSHMQLKQSRTATNATGAPAPWPTEADGKAGTIPIYVTPALTNSE